MLFRSVLDIAVTPDRGYALSMRGIARELAISYGVPFDDPGLVLADLPAPVAAQAPQDCATEDPTGCDLFTMRTIVGFDPSAASPAWMQQRLTACGMRPVSLAVDVTNYVMLELGQPLHAYDRDKLRGTVRAGRAEPGEPFESLDHVERTLSADDLVRGQFRGYRQEAGVAADSRVETYAAVRLHLDSWRWADVPFFIRAGKCLADTATEVQTWEVARAVQFVPESTDT